MLINMQDRANNLLNNFIYLAICSALICRQAVFEFHYNISQGTVLGHAPFHALAPHPK